MDPPKSEHRMKFFQHLVIKKQEWERYSKCRPFQVGCNLHCSRFKKGLKRFHPMGQTETSMAGVIRGSR